MSDRAAVRTLALGPVNIDVDPLMIASSGCERVDARLVDRDPIRYAELLAEVFAHLSNCKIAHARLLPVSLRQSPDPATAISYMLPHFWHGSFLSILRALVLASWSTNRIRNRDPAWPRTTAGPVGFSRRRTDVSSLDYRLSGVQAI
jgi:hypothetical protein